MFDNTQATREQLIYSLDPVRYAESLDLPFSLYDWQKEVLSITSGDVVINGARQAGKSTIVSIPPVHRARFYPGSLSVVIAPTLVQAGEDMEKIKSVMQHDEHFPAIVRSNDSEIRLDNGSRIVVAPATDAARGKSAPSLVILDEASRIDEFVFSEVVLPMFTKSSYYLFLRISTPNGKKGFFYNDFNDTKVRRFEVRSPYDVSPNDNYVLIPSEDEQLYTQRRAKDGIRAYYSPNHMDFNKQQGFLERMGKLRYQQEFCCQFVEPEDQVFRYSDIEAMFNTQAKSDNIDNDPILTQAPPEVFTDVRGVAI